MPTLSVILLITFLAQSQSCNTVQPKVAEKEDDSSSVIILSVSLAVCLAVLVMCGGGMIWLYKRQKDRKVEKHIDTNPDYGDGDDYENYNSKVVDTNEYYD